MPNVLRAFLGPRATDEDARRREYILNIILAGSIVMLVILDGVVLYDSIYHAKPLQTMASFQEFSIFPAFFIFLYALSRRGFFALASYLLIGAYFFGNSYAAYRWGVNVPTALVGYALLIVIASILISARSAFFVAAATGLFVLPLWYAQLHSLMFRDAENFTTGDGIALVVLYGLIMVVAWLSNREIEKSLMRARVSEHALKDERDSLEVKVEERTRELQLAQLEKMDQLYRFAEFGQLASGLFHDLTSVLNALSLQVERDSIRNGTDAFGMQKEIDHFVEAVRKQLRREDVADFFSLIEGIERAVVLLAHQCHTAGVRLSFAQPTDAMPMYFGNASKFHQVIMNLLTNAIESDCRAIYIRLSYDGGDAVVEIEDDGSGISPEAQGKIFEPFFTTKQGDKKGIGLGLAITKRIVENDFHGTIAIRGAKEKGSIFTVRFSLANEPSSTITTHREGDRDHKKRAAF